MKTLTKHNLNLSPKYAPKWGAWEIAREFICNAIDADPEGYEARPKGSDTLVITTRTAPGLAELFMIGEGSKNSDDENIGQFGEGAKIAALAATRGGSVEVLIPGSKITFEFEDTFGTPSLFANVEDSTHDLGCTITIKYPGIATASTGKILGIKGTQPLEKGREGTMQIYCKGVWICERKSNSLFDWNVDQMELNRDRSAISGSSVITYIASYGITKLTDEQIQRIIKSDGNNDESNAIEYLYNDGVRNRIKDVFESTHGSTALISVDSENNQIADERAIQNGHVVVTVTVDTAKALKRVGVKETKSLALSSDGLEAVDSAKYQGIIDQLRTLDPMIGAPQFSLSIFQTNANKMIEGLADMMECRIWLSESLFVAGDMHKIIQVYLHEVARLLCGATDGTRTFEDSLDWIAATFAMKQLEVTQ